jgi:hypothetical protein
MSNAERLSALHHPRQEVAPRGKNLLPNQQENNFHHISHFDLIRVTLAITAAVTGAQKIYESAFTPELIPPTYSTAHEYLEDDHKFPDDISEAGDRNLSFAFEPIDHEDNTREQDHTHELTTNSQSSITDSDNREELFSVKASNTFIEKEMINRLLAREQRLVRFQANAIIVPGIDTYTPSFDSQEILAGNNPKQNFIERDSETPVYSSDTSLTETAAGNVLYPMHSRKSDDHVSSPYDSQVTHLPGAKLMNFKEPIKNHKRQYCQTIIFGLTDPRDTLSILGVHTVDKMIDECYNDPIF